MKEKIENIIDSSYFIILVVAGVQALWLLGVGFGAAVAIGPFSYKEGLFQMATSSFSIWLGTIIEYVIASIYAIALIIALIYDVLYSEKPERLLKVAMLEFVIFLLMSCVIAVPGKLLVGLCIAIVLCLLFGGVFIGPLITTLGSLGVVLGVFIMQCFSLLGPLLTIIAVLSFVMSFFT